MKSLTRFILLCAIVGGGFFLYQHASQRATPPLGESLRVGISADNPPFTFLKNGEFTGFEIDLARALAAELAYNFELLDLDFSGLIPAVQNNVVDLAIAGFNITPERKKNIAFSDPYYSGEAGVIAREPISDAQQLAGKRIGFQHGSLWEEEAKKLASQQQGVSLVGFHKINQIVQELEQESIDAILIETTVAQQIANIHKHLIVSAIPAQSEQDGFGIVFKLNSPLVPKFNTALAKLASNGMLDALKKKWFTNAQKDAPNTGNTPS